MKLLLLLIIAPFVCSDRTVITNSGPVRGISLEAHNIEAFLGIPYAEPPVGPLRFSKPVPKVLWEDIYDANELPPSCVQAIQGLLAADPKRMSEDCLYLNLWVPNSGNDPKPIMVFIHGGAFMFGSSNLKIYDGARLAERGDVIVATMNYRVGSLGFFSGFTDDASGNMGMYDQVLALEWIKENAEFFGGDPNNIILFGQSAGAFSVSLHMLSPLSKNLFRRAILQSGSAFHPIYTDSNENLLKSSEAIAKISGCTNESEPLKSKPEVVVECMRRLPGNVFSNIDLFFIRKGGILIPRVGDEFLPVNPIDLFKKGGFKNAELLVGVTRNEGTALLAIQRPDVFGRLGDKVDTFAFNETSAKYLLKSIIKIGNDNKIIESYLDRSNFESRHTYLNAMADAMGDFLINCGVVYQAEYHSLKKNQVYFYMFDYRTTSSPLADWMGVAHLDDVPYVFGNSFHKDFTQYEKELSNDMMDMWLAFAKTGNPNVSKGLKWPLYTYEDPKYFIIGNRDRIGVGPDNQRCKKWRRLFRANIDNDVVQHSSVSTFD